MLINSPRARLPVACTSGAAFLMPEIVGVCAEASSAAAKKTTPASTVRVRIACRTGILNCGISSEIILNEKATLSEATLPVNAVNRI
jgi:hypothetical protein